MHETEQPVRRERTWMWCFASLLATAAVAWIAFQLQQEGIAPAVLFPLSVGGALGTIVAAAGRATRAPARRTMIVAAIGLGLLVVVGQDYIGHRHRLRQYDAEQRRQTDAVAAVLAAQPELRPTLGEHLAQRVRAQPLWWCLELVLTASACAAATAIGTHEPRRGSHEPDTHNG